MVLPLLGAEGPKSGLTRADGARFTKNFENLEMFEKLWLENAITMNMGDLLNKISLNFFLQKMSYLIV